MQRFFSILAETVTRFEGTVDKFTGDGIMAIFGAPIAHEDHARRACYAALQMLDDVAEYAAELRRAKGLNFSTRIGINSGEVVAGAIDGGGGSSYTAIGHTVGLAQRMEALAEPGKAYLTESTAELARGYLDLARPRRVRDQGREPAGAGLRAGRGRAGALPPRPRPRARLLQLRRPRRRSWRGSSGRWRGPKGGEAAAVGVVAEPGIGKSRLYHEFAQRCRARGARGLRGAGTGARQVDPVHADPADAALLLRDRRPGPRADGAREDRRPLAAPRPRLRRRPAADLRLPRRSRPRAAGAADGPRGPAARPRRLPLPPGPQPGAPQDPGPGGRGPALDRRGQPGDAGGPGRGDGRDANTLVLVNYRPEYDAGLGGLAGLPRRSSCSRSTAPTPRSCCATSPAQDPSLDGIDEPIHERTSGNPFFIEEIVRELAESGYLRGRARRLPAGEADRGRRRAGHRPGRPRRPHRPPRPRPPSSCCRSPRSSARRSAARRCGMTAGHDSRDDGARRSAS